MKSIIIIFLLFFPVISIGQTLPDAPVINFDSLRTAKAKESIGQSFPAFSSGINGIPFRNTDLKGKTVFIN